MMIAGKGISMCYDANYARLKAHILDYTGLVYYEDKDHEFTRCVEERMDALKLGRFADYADLVFHASKGSEELDLLIEHLTIGETHFFRHQEMFDAVRSIVIPALYANNRTHPIRIWSAACSNGAEAYSMAITFRNEDIRQDSPLEISILGTDINRSALRQAYRAQYSEWDLRTTGEDVRAACFTRQNGTWIVHERYRAGVEFCHHNLVKHAFQSSVRGLSDLDVILCRNVLMYFDQPTICRIVRQLFDCLADGGWLIVGHADINPELFSMFEMIPAPGATLYRKHCRGSISGSREHSTYVGYPAISILNGVVTADSRSFVMVQMSQKQGT